MYVIYVFHATFVHIEEENGEKKTILKDVDEDKKRYTAIQYFRLESSLGNYNIAENAERFIKAKKYPIILNDDILLTTYLFIKNQRGILPAYGDPKSILPSRNNFSFY